MKKKLIKIMLTLAVAAAPMCAKAQAPAPEQAEQHARPIELQTFIIEGKEVLNVPSGIKQFPSRTQPMMKTELDSLNSLVKMQSTILPPKPLPTAYFAKPVHSGYFGAEIGLYTSPKVNAGYSMTLDGYNLFATAGLENSNGSTTNADYTDASLKISSDYIAPDKFIFFGGSRTRAHLDFRALNYNLYGLVATPHRNTNNFSIGIESKGSPDGNTCFNMGASMDMYSLSTTGLGKTDDSRLGGFAELTTKYNEFEFGGALGLGFNSYNESGMSLDLSGLVKYRIDGSLYAKGRLGIETAKNSVGTNRVAPIVGIEVWYDRNKDVTFVLGLDASMQKSTLAGLTLSNPYLTDTLPLVDYGSKIDFSLTIKYHPSERFMGAATAGLATNNRAPIFSSDSAKNMSLAYLGGHVAYLNVEADYYITKNDKLNASVRYQQAKLTDADFTTYTPAILVGANYRRAWLPEFATQASVSYIGKKYTDIANTRELDAYLHLALRADYSINEKLSINARLENLINSEVYLWDGYKERDLFFGIGLLMKF